MKYIETLLSLIPYVLCSSAYYPRRYDKSAKFKSKRAFTQ